MRLDGHGWGIMMVEFSIALQQGSGAGCRESLMNDMIIFTEHNCTKAILFVDLASLVFQRAQLQASLISRVAGMVVSLVGDEVLYAYEDSRSR